MRILEKLSAITEVAVLWLVALVIVFSLSSAVVFALHLLWPDDLYPCTPVPIIQDAMVELELQGEDALAERLRLARTCDQGKGQVVEGELRRTVVARLLQDQKDQLTYGDYQLRFEVLRGLVK